VTPSVTPPSTPPVTPTSTPTPSVTPVPTVTPSPTSAPTCNNYSIEGAPSIDIEWTECDGTPNSATVTTAILICAQVGSVYATGGEGNITQLGSCFGPPSPTPSPSPSVTPSVTPDPTPCPSTSPAGLATILIGTNMSLDIEMDLSNMTVNGVNVTNVSGVDPNTSGNGGSVDTNQIGTYDIVLTYTATTAGQRITLYDSNTTYYCNNTSTGFNSMTFSNVVIDGAMNLLLTAEDGTC
jgi:hypothetical protein